MGVTLELNDYEAWTLKHALRSQAARFRDRGAVLGTEEVAWPARRALLNIHARLVNPTST